MNKPDYIIVCDGGSRGHGVTNEGYGSYRLSARGGREQIIRLDFGTATNNEAEYHALIAALHDLTGRIQRAGKSTAEYSVVVYTDSQLIIGQLTQGWRVHAPNLRPLVDRARGLVEAFGECAILKAHRDEIVSVLGH